MISFVLGFLMVANFYIIPYLEKTPRATDIVGIFLLAWLFWRFVRVGLNKKVFWVCTSLVGLVFITWAYIGLVNEWQTTLVLSIRWILALPWAYAIYQICKHPSSRLSFIYGLWYGAAFNVLVLGLQFFGLKELTQNLGLAAQDSATSYIYGNFRTPGMHGHPNGAAAVVSLVIPVALYVVLAENKRLVWLILSLGLLFLGGAFTYTRSAVLVSVLTLVIGLLLSIWLKKSFLIKMLAMAFLVSLAVYWVGPPGGWERWLDQSNVEINLHERLLTNLLAMDLAIQHPLGLGWETAREEMIAIGGARATHNAFFHTALVFGILPSAIMLLSMVILIIRLFLERSPRLENLLALHTFGLFLFEEHHNNPTFIILSSYLFLVCIMHFRLGGAALDTVRSVAPTSTIKNYSFTDHINIHLLRSSRLRN
jgi:hypothetical protein